MVQLEIMAIHYDGKRFRPVTNSPAGQVNGETLFIYRQQGSLLTATYAGGGIRQGQMLGTVGASGELAFCYHHVTDNGELRSGVCRSLPEPLPDGRLRLHEKWRWTHGESSAGESIVEETTG